MVREIIDVGLVLHQGLNQQKHKISDAVTLLLLNFNKL
jgi:hypothetical protein